MKISVFGLGYVGTISAACLAQLGHEVIGVDVNPNKVRMIEQGQSPVMEADVARIIPEQTKAQRLKATDNGAWAFARTNLSLICVGTPGKDNGAIDLTYVRRVFEEMGDYLSSKPTFHWIVLRSTVLPGTTEQTLIPILEEKSGKSAGKDFGVCFNPEFLREGSSVWDFFNPPKTVIGLLTSHDDPPLLSLYESLPAPVIKTSIREAELVKYLDNVFHALKICFANEIGKVCQALKVDSHALMNIFIQDTKLNISPMYLKPGFAFGGSCLPKDTRALLYMAKSLDLELPVLQAILPSNEAQLREGLRLILKTKKKKVGLLGLSFKEGTDDLRESPLVLLAETLLGKGFDLRIYDPQVFLGNLFGTNKDFIERIIPHLGQLLTQDLEGLLTHAEVIVIGSKIQEVSSLRDSLRDDQEIIDLVRAFPENWGLRGSYQGISW
ncbi:MAG: nucleotide sugar dehydrogenase [Thermodesulfobacteriota bacterium]|jgi:GDP-mannose 6-dehydrogenase